jgi:hypothetical protein
MLNHEPCFANLEEDHPTCLEQQSQAQNVTVEGHCTIETVDLDPNLSEGVIAQRAEFLRARGGTGFSRTGARGDCGQRENGE